ncbi:phosphonate metabolism protein/1,5-bisphosphokinase (PRPP-forming) PhnN [Pseudodesulfovibrio sp. F-1]|uniref:Ribose 1,5-bisphosphate phosphokinase PhnN n=1 Tax=Pseudodesulfovibrio alkaliphilus TaxID=2661613 RepID=A0A7K1KSE3_9BACT|nr:phosphonate metabolism protein/1,5-bisphosphokinase (PRPP-forming) PhnN [Pseudodesulfovibrio alkaliphilus]MUM78852.1 phosphonate metabolism protein/1,5-bisphosphokinase (PRPP-forming) PhnN [Pseudodesulfovibrio alkaliphilus]
MNSGRLIYVIGPSGCGKDSVMAYARRRCPGSEAAFAHRYITRSAEAGGENHIHLEPDEFEARARCGVFALHWNSHGHRYGIGCEVDAWMEAGFNVVVNGSRAYLPEAARRYPDMIPTLIAVETDILRQRLLARGRESTAEIECRLEQAEAYVVSHPELRIIDNNGELQQAGNALLALARNGCSVRGGSCSQALLPGRQPLA